MLWVQGLLLMGCSLWFNELCTHGVPQVQTYIQEGIAELKNATKAFKKDVNVLINKVENVLNEGQNLLDGKNATLADMAMMDEEYQPESFSLTTNQAYYCSLCCYAGDVYVLTSLMGNKTEVGHGYCEFGRDLYEADEDKNVSEIYLGYYLRPSSCFYPKALKVFTLGKGKNNIPIEMEARLGGARSLMTVINDEAAYWKEQGISTIWRASGTSYSGNIYRDGVLVRKTMFVGNGTVEDNVKGKETQTGSPHWEVSEEIVFPSGNE